MDSYTCRISNVLKTLESEREKACVLCLRPGASVPNVLRDKLEVVSIRDALIRRLDVKGGNKTCLLVDEELQALRGYVRQRPTLITETEFHITRLRATFGEAPSEEARARFWTGLQRMPHLDHPLLYGCLPNLMPTPAVWNAQRRLLVLDEEELCLA